MRKTHAPYYTDPIELAEGEEFVLSGRRDAWEENQNHIWLWAMAEDGREGWVPEGFALTIKGKTIAPHAYAARELGVEAGTQVRVLRETNGWAWCEDASGGSGWVPLSNFEKA